ncbi:hypothetical protein [Clostridium butyricum]|uniref:hypothetical protein n=1 Tax=Clostridium butyricum TaxID=1492 RepID=UPI0025A3B596|nr:hypothetical protein [Clostridium butyricum]MDM8130089.1 hypothetical protein [Clostridium butyricum]MDM8228216.1 hypothetical protein [Clostridium butyricum]
MNKRKRNKTHITGIVYPIEDLGTVMIDILEKQLGAELLEKSMKELEKKVKSKQ